jgi:hypothetical protein
MTTNLMHRAILGRTDDLLRAAAARQRAGRHRPNPPRRPRRRTAARIAAPRAQAQ